MSASREKKLRQELAAQEGYVDPKARRAAEESAAARRSRALYLTIAAAFVLVAAAVIVLRSGVLQRSATAVTVDGEKFTAAEMDYFYYSAYNEVRSNSYAGYLGIESGTPLSQQPVGDMAKMLLGISGEEGLTWDAYFKDTAKDNLSRLFRLSKAAREAGYTLSGEVKEAYDAEMELLETYAKTNGYSAGAYLKLIYGSNMTRAAFADIQEMVLLAQKYQSDYIEGLTYTDEQREAYYAENRLDVDEADYETVFFRGTADATTDADGNTVEPTDSEQAAAKATARAAAADTAARYAAGESLSDIAADYGEKASYSHSQSASYAGTELSDWVFDAARKAGDTTVIHGDSGSYFVLFHSCDRPTYPVVNVRHILSLADTGELDPDSDTYEEDSQAIWDEARADAEANLEKWRSGEATAESFAALAEEASDDAGSASNGGLIGNVSRSSSSYVPAFLDWCFADGRQVGDAGIIESSYGCHVMYLDSFGEPYWEQQVNAAMQSEDYSAWIESLTADIVVEDGPGMKYVG